MNNLGGYGGGGQMQNFGNMMGSGQADPYQQQPTASGGMGTIDSQGTRNRFGGYPGTRPSAGAPAPQASWGGPNYSNMPQQAQDMLRKQNPNIAPFLSGGNQGPYQMPGGPAQISTQPRMPGMLGPRPRPMGNMPNLNQNQLNALRPGPMNNRPGMGIGPGGPTRSVPGFQPNAWQGFGRGNIQNPYQPQGQNRGW
jgi:hypothetical protein